MPAALLVRWVLFDEELDPTNHDFCNIDSARILKFFGISGTLVFCLLP